MTGEPKEYQVQNMSNWSSFIFVLAAPLSLFVFVGIGLAFGGGVFSFIIGFGAIVGLMIFLFKYLQQKILVVVEKDSIIVKYLHRPFFESNSDMNIPLNDIESYKFDSFNGARFILYLKDGRRFKVAIGNVGKTAPIEEMAKHIITLITDRSHASGGLVASPVRRKTYAEGNMGLVLAIIALAAIVTITIAVFFFPQNHNNGDTVRGIGSIVMCIAFIIHVFKLRRKSRNEKK